MNFRSLCDTTGWWEIIVRTPPILDHASIPVWVWMKRHILLAAAILSVEHLSISDILIFSLRVKAGCQNSDHSHGSTHPDYWTIQIQRHTQISPLHRFCRKKILFREIHEAWDHIRKSVRHSGAGHSDLQENVRFPYNELFVQKEYRRSLYYREMRSLRNA